MRLVLEDLHALYAASVVEAKDNTNENFSYRQGLIDGATAICELIRREIKASEKEMKKTGKAGDKAKGGKKRQSGGGKK